ncbi:ATP synthase F0 subunit B [Deltaproteobacteria bacterium OttesenSCG-928-K17]|nr:ATP synthase F0 subunit B [Deltaproteobacteria bacterium OttesenSCG-928-K17]
MDSLVSITLDRSLIVQLVNFLLLIFVLNHFLYKPIQKILAERRELFDRLKEKSAKAKIDLESGEAEKARLNAESVRQALSLKNEILAKSQKEERDIMAEANEEAARLINDGRGKLAQSLGSARSALVQEVQGISQEMAEKVLGRKI